MRQLITNTAQVGEIIRGRRRAQRLSQHELATKVGITQSRLSVLEADPGSLSLERLILLANLLGLELVIQNKTDAPKSKAEW
jgi:HTH-type transcriptional regulator/antitoxin HipB